MFYKVTAFQVISAIGVLLAVVVALKKFYKIEKDAEALAARCAELDKKLGKAGEDYTDALNRVREYNDKQIERQEDEIKQMHEALDKGAASSMEKLDRLKVELGGMSTLVKSMLEKVNRIKKPPTEDGGPFGS